jgi:hypothetical protein
VSRIVTALALALFLFQAVGVSMAPEIPCAGECEDDGPDGQCAPTCQDCLCCAHARAVFSAPAEVMIPGAVRVGRVCAADGAPPQADAGDILRVPKPRA